MLTFCMLTIESEADRLQFEKLYRKYADDIFRRVYGILKNQQDTEDVVQETWIKVAKNLSLFYGRDEKMVYAYIMRIAKNLSLSWIRKNKKKKEMVSTMEDIEIADEKELFYICDDCGEQEIVACIRSLDHIYSDVLVYYYLHHYSAKEIAKLLDLKEDTARKRITRGREQMIQLLIRRGYHG